MNHAAMITRKIPSILVLGIILSFAFPANAQPDSGQNNTYSPRLWTINPLTLSGINKIPAASISQSDNEKLILQIIKLVEVGNLLEATRKAKSLIESKPNYALAQLIYADLLNLQISKKIENDIDKNSNASDTVPPRFATSTPVAIKAAQQELSLRLRASSSEPSGSSIPKNVISLGTQYRQLLVADTKIGRLFVFDIRRRNKSTTLELKHSFFMTIGDQGAGKMIEGDKKTPLGIYQLLNKVPQNLLTDLYGLGAIQTNYPNPVDRIMGKTGYGIWFHGTPSQVYVRYPLASDGCLVVSNDDMSSLLTSTTPQRTLVIIDDGIEWVQASKTQFSSADHPIYRKLSEAFTTLNGTSQNSNLSHLYNGGFKWEYRLLRLIQNNKSNDRKFNIDNISLITWNKDSAYAMAEFDFRFNSNTKTHRIRQYWMQNQDDWKIVHESIF